MANVAKENRVMKPQEREWILFYFYTIPLSIWSSPLIWFTNNCVLYFFACSYHNFTWPFLKINFTESVVTWIIVSSYLSIKRFKYMTEFPIHITTAGIFFVCLFAIYFIISRALIMFFVSSKGFSWLRYLRADKHRISHSLFFYSWWQVHLL